MSVCIDKADLIKDEEDIRRFWKQNFEKWPQEKFHWFYRENPVGSARCWIVKDSKTGYVVGATAVFPRRFYVNGKNLTGAITGDFGMDKNYRILGPALKIQKSSVSSDNGDSFDFYYGYPNDRSEPVQKRAGFKVVGSTQRMVKVIRSKNYIRRRIRSEALSNIVAKFVDLGLRLFSGEYGRYGWRKYRTERLSAFDHRFDELWKRACRNYSVVGERSSEFLNWRFARCPYRDFGIFTLEETGSGKIHGYIVFYVSQKDVRIADIFAEDLDRFIPPLVKAFVSFIRKTGAETISLIYFGNERLVEILQKHQFSIRDSERKIVAYNDCRTVSNDYIYNKDNWYLTEGDND